MSDLNKEDVLKWCRENDYQLVPYPDEVNHDFRPGDRVVRSLSDMTKGIAEKSGVAEDFDLEEKTGTILAVASRADVIFERDEDGRVIFAMSNGLDGEPSLRKLEASENNGD